MPPSAPPVPRILVVDDEPHVRKFLRLSLQAEGFNVLEASTAEEAITLVHTAKPSLMILDLGLPDIDGQQVVCDVRLTSDMPILILSGRTEDSEKIAALEQGADDYMTKPFAVRDLVQRVRAALQQQAARSGWNEAGSVKTGNLSIRLQASEVTRDDQKVPLEDEEYALLRLLAQHGGRVLTFGRIERALWGKPDGGDERQRDLQKRIGALRRKLEAEPSFPRYIVTEPAVGYRLEIVPAEGRQ
ncbi:MAG: response regulator transcription factor [Alphaproteobacteria bacterium]|nr:response regulator transcription factor [Alphaproteobacteria bacterium]